MPHVREGLDSAAPVGTELAIVLGANLALGDFLDIASAADPVTAEFRKAGHDVDARRRLSVGTAGIIKDDGWFAA